MTLRDFDEILDIRSEIDMLNKRLNDVKNPGYVGDYAKDYSTGEERIISIAGYPLADPVKKEKIHALIKNRAEHLENKILEAEHFIDSIQDSRIRTFLTLRYIEGLDWKDVAERVYHKMKPDSVRKAVNKFFDEQ